MEEQKEEDEGAEDDGGSNRGIRSGGREGGRKGGRKRGRLGGKRGKKGWMEQREERWKKEKREASTLTPSPPCSLLPPLLTGVNLVFTLYRQTMEYAI